MKDPLLTTDEVANELHTSAPIVCRMIRRGDLVPAVKTGRRYLVPESTLRRYLAARTIGGAA